MLNVRNQHSCFGRGDLRWIDIKTMEGKVCNNVLAFSRKYNNSEIISINNLSDKELIIKSPLNNHYKDLLGNDIKTDKDNNIILEGYSYYWLKLE